MCPILRVVSAGQRGLGRWDGAVHAMRRDQRVRSSIRTSFRSPHCYSSDDLLCDVLGACNAASPVPPSRKLNPTYTNGTGLSMREFCAMSSWPSPSLSVASRYKSFSECDREARCSATVVARAIDRWPRPRAATAFHPDTIFRS